MRRDVDRDSGVQRQVSNQFPERLPGNHHPAVIEKYVIRVRIKFCTVLGQVISKLISRDCGERCDSLFFALALDSHVRKLQIHVMSGKPYQLRSTEAGRVENEDHRAIARAKAITHFGRLRVRKAIFGCGQKCVDVFDAEVLWETSALAWAFDFFCWVVAETSFETAEFKELTERACLARDGCWLQGLLMETGEELIEVGGLDFLEWPALVDRDRELNEVATIGFDRLIACAAIETLGLDERFDVRGKMMAHPTSVAAEEGLAMLERAAEYAG